jgi:hypothetical protein
LHDAKLLVMVGNISAESAQEVQKAFRGPALKMTGGSLPLQVYLFQWKILNALVPWGKGRVG